SPLVLAVLRCFLSTAPSPPEIYTLSLHDALPISFGAFKGFEAGFEISMPDVSSPPAVEYCGRAGGGFGRPAAGTLSSLWLRTFADRKSTRLNSSHVKISYAVFCLKKKKTRKEHTT